MRNPGYCSEQVSIDSRVLQDLDSDSNDKTRRKIAININIGPFHNGEIARRFISQLLWRTSGLEFQPKRHQVSLWLIEKRPKKVLEQIATGRPALSLVHDSTACFLVAGTLSTIIIMASQWLGSKRRSATSPLKQSHMSFGMKCRWPRQRCEHIIIEATREGIILSKHLLPSSRSRPGDGRTNRFSAAKSKSPAQWHTASTFPACPLPRT